MKRYLPKNAEDASALVLTLLVIVLLSAIVTSFLSSTRTEQTATRNYTSKTQAEMLVNTATQQAMAKIQQGFNTTNATSGSSSGNNTQVVTTQPGRITKYFFLNGNCTGNATTALYTENGSTPADMNNFQNPGNTTVSANQSFTITGNATDRLIVNMENVTSNGTLIGRIAYYVDDELTKINMNAATGNRTTLNVSTPRSNSLSGLASNNSTLTVTSSQITLFQNIIDGNGANSSNLSNWSHFFRNEQLSPSTTFNATAVQLAQISTAPLSDFHLKYTPWGTRRLHINDEPLDKTGVDNVYEALAGVNATTGNISASPSSYELNGRALRNIYGQTFNDKYGQNWSWTGNMALTANTTVNGLKQTIANMLQMRALGHHDNATVTAGYTGAVISENGTAAFPPSGYYARVPSGILNEFGIKIDYMETTNGLTIYVKPFIEIVCPFEEGYGGAKVRVEAQIQSINYTIQGANGNSTTLSGGPYTLSDNVNLEDYDNFSKCVLNGWDNTQIRNWDKLVISVNSTTTGLPALGGLPWRIIGNPTVVMGDVKLFAGTSNSSNALRDWIQGDFINEKLGNGASLALNTPLKITHDLTDPTNALPNFNSGNTTLQRIDPRITGKTAWTVAPHTFPLSGNKIMTDQGDNQLSQGGGHNTWYAGYGIRPRESATRDIPGDPSSRGWNESDFWTATERQQVYFLQKLNTLDATSSIASQTNATFNTPHDLGKVPTNVNWRRLRFMPRHTNESAKNLIPDWAMLDVMSFSSNNSSRSILKIAPMNPNGSFALDTSLNTTTIPSPRNNLAALIKPLESSTATNFKLGSAIARSGAGANMTFEAKDMSSGGGSNSYVAFRGNATMATSLSNNIQNRVWSTQNGTSAWSAWRGGTRGWPSTSLVLPGEVTEISGLADYGRRSQYDYLSNTAPYSIKENEGRLSAFFPGLTTCSNFFTIYAYAQAGQLQNKTQPESASNPFVVDSEALTKTLVEVEIAVTANATTQAQYKVKKLYTQPILIGD